MKKVVTHVKPYLLEEVIRTIQEFGVNVGYIEEIKQYDLITQKSFLPRMKLQLFVVDELVDEIIKKITLQCVNLDEKEEEWEIIPLIETIDIHTGEKNIL